MNPSKVHTIHLPGDGSEDNYSPSILGTEITNFWGTKLEGVMGFCLEPNVTDPSMMATITLRVPVRIVYKEAK